MVDGEAHQGCSAPHEPYVQSHRHKYILSDLVPTTGDYYHAPLAAAEHRLSHEATAEKTQCLVGTCHQEGSCISKKLSVELCNMVV
jgi:hypothetical protein